MKNNIFKNITIITAISMLLLTVLIIVSFVLVSTSDSKKELRTYSETCNKQIEKIENKDDLDKFNYYKKENNIRITVFTSSGRIYKDTTGIDMLSEIEGNQMEALVYLVMDETEIGTNLELVASPYTDQNAMHVLYTKVKVPFAVDENEFLIVRYSISSIIGSRAFHVLLITLAGFWLLVIAVLFILFWYNIQASMKPLEQVQAIMNDIQAGTYKASKETYSVFDSQADKMVSQIDKIGDLINNNLLEMEMVLDSIKQGVITFDKNGSILYQNKAAKELLNFDIIKSGGVRKFFDTIGFKEDLNEAFNNRKESSLELSINEKVLKVENIFTRTDQMDTIGIYMLLVITDITEEKNALKYKNQFFADASHELKTPLTAITGYSEMLSISTTNEKVVKKCSDEINKNAIRMKALIEEMLQLSKMENIKTDIEFEQISLRNILDSIIEDLSVIAKKKQVDINISGEATIMGNKKLIIMLYKNLISNAIKYNKENGSIDVNISEDSDKVYLSVKDTGIGIAKEHLTKIFERFYRVEESRTTNDQVESSTGLGLSIVQKICDLHNAKIQVESILGEGTEFKIIFNK
ncbi:MAG: ATP-binding protein [Christensenella sp.]|nr:ATP-binding protein [Christensenella sp.]